MMHFLMHFFHHVSVHSIAFLKSVDMYIYAMQYMKNSSCVFYNKNKSALILKLLNFNLSSGFYGLPDNIAQDIVSELHIQ